MAGGDIPAAEILGAGLAGLDRAGRPIGDADAIEPLAEARELAHEDAVLIVLIVLSRNVPGRALRGVVGAGGGHPVPVLFAALLRHRGRLDEAFALQPGLLGRSPGFLGYENHAAPPVSWPCMMRQSSSRVAGLLSRQKSSLYWTDAAPLPSRGLAAGIRAPHDVQ
jgi:hypothetical protein